MTLFNITIDEFHKNLLGNQNRKVGMALRIGYPAIAFACVINAGQCFGVGT